MSKLCISDFKKLATCLLKSQNVPEPYYIVVGKLKKKNKSPLQEVSSLITGLEDF